MVFIVLFATNSKFIFHCVSAENIPVFQDVSDLCFCFQTDFDEKDTDDLSKDLKCSYLFKYSVIKKQSVTFLYCLRERNKQTKSIHYLDSDLPPPVFCI